MMSQSYHSGLGMISMVQRLPSMTDRLGCMEGWKEAERRQIYRMPKQSLNYKPSMTQVVLLRF